MSGAPPDGNDAAAQLGIAPGAAPAEARAAFCRRLAEQDFVPAVPLLEAYRTVAGQELPGANDGISVSANSAEERLRDELEEFAAQFFAIAIGERRRQWESLCARCRGIPGLEARLAALAPGLELDTDPRPDVRGNVNELVGHLRELFCLRPAERAIRRQELIEEMQPTMSAWERAARSLQKGYPRDAALDPALVHRLADATALRKKAAKARVRPPSPPREPSKSTNWVVFYIAIAIIANFLRSGCERDKKKDTSPPPRPLRAAVAFTAPEP